MEDNQQLATSRKGSFVSIIRNFDDVTEDLNIMDIPDWIASEKFKTEVDAIRLLIQQDKKKEAQAKKEHLLAFTPSATFNKKRSGTGINKYSGFVHLDFDNLPQEQLETAFKTISEIPYTVFCFRSPSGNGFKVFVKVNSGKEHHPVAYEQVLHYFEFITGLKADEICKDIPRLCFMSYDPALFKNDTPKVFEVQIPQLEESTGKVIEPKKIISDNNDDVLRLLMECVELTNKKLTYLDGTRNAYIYLLASNTNRKGIEEDVALKFCLENYDLDKQEMTSTVHSAYKNHSHEFATTKENSDKNNFVRVENYLKENFDFRYNTISNEVEFKLKEDDDYETCNEYEVYCRLRKANYKISQADLKAILCSSFIVQYNPFSEYFNGLDPWPETHESEIEHLCSFITANDQERFNAQFKKALIRTIAGAINTNVYNKHAFVLISPNQNIGKSYFCRWLCPKQLSNYISENMAADKDSLIALCENFIINLDELATLSRTEINHLKSIFSKESDKSRRPFDKRAITRHRTASFWGSTNNEEFLTDETGSVRWLCFEILDIDKTYSVKVDIDRIWAEAYSLYLEGTPYQLTRDEIIENETANRVHQVQTAEMQLIQKNYKPATRQEHTAFYSATDFLENLNNKYPGGFKLNIIQIGKALKFLGFEKMQQYNGVYQEKGYFVDYIS